MTLPNGEKDSWKAAVVAILQAELRLVARPDYDETETWMVKPGNIEHCAGLIVDAIFDPD